MRPFFLFIALMMFLSSVTCRATEPDCAIKEDPIWYVCAKDQDCSFVRGPCYIPVAVALKYKGIADSFYACEAMRANCAATANPAQKVVVGCVSKKCKIAYRQSTQ